VKKTYSGSISAFHMEIYKLKVLLKPCNSRTWIEKIPAGETEIRSTYRTLPTKTRYNLYNHSYLPAHFIHSIGSQEFYVSGIPWETLLDRVQSLLNELYLTVRM